MKPAKPTALGDFRGPAACAAGTNISSPTA